VIAIALLAAAAPAQAIDVGLNAGTVEVVGLPDGNHLGFYPYVGVSLTKAWKRVALIPSLAVELAPENRHWGFVGALTVDFPVAKHLGLDVDAVLLHDQPGVDFRAAELLVGAGGGCSIFLGRWTLSLYVNAFYDLVVPGWAIVPGVNLAFTL
jgi:hypothetical protein